MQRYFKWTIFRNGLDCDGPIHHAEEHGEGTQEDLNRQLGAMLLSYGGKCDYSRDDEREEGSTYYFCRKHDEGYSAASISFSEVQEEDTEESSDKCICGDCGKIFKRGTEGDNEKFCLRCERQSLTEGMDELDYDDFDRLSES